MILNRKYYSKVSVLKSWWALRRIRQWSGEKLFKTFKLHKTEWPNTLYFYSPRLKRIPRFTGNKELLSNWKNSKVCERICPTKAIQVTASAFNIDCRRCISCGLCIELAPPGVLEVSNETFLRQIE